MSTPRIIESLTPEHFGRCCPFWNSRDDWFLSRDLIRLHRYNGSVLIQDLTPAMKAGQQCDHFTFRWWPDDAIPFGIDEIFRRHEFNLRAVFTELQKLPWQRQPLYGGGVSDTSWQPFRNHGLAALLPELPAPVGVGHSLELFRDSKPGRRVFSPFVKVHPLPAAPAKWTIPHVIRALLNGQFADLQCTGVYTDDYAYDAAANYRQGVITNATAFARRIIESPSGWWTGANGDSVSVCCHSFDNNRFRFVLNPPKHETHSHQPTAVALC